MTTTSREHGEPLRIATDGVSLRGLLQAPPHPWGVVIVADVGPRPAGGGPDCSALRDVGLATVTVDLLTGAEHGDARRILDVFLLARRLGAMTDAVRRADGVRDLRIGYLAGGTAAAGALLASVGDGRVAAVVCRRGRPNLAEGILGQVTAATLLMPHRADRAGLEANAIVLAKLQCRKKLVAVAGLETGTRNAVDWLARHLGDADEPAQTAATWPGKPAGTLPVRRPPARATA